MSHKNIPVLPLPLETIRYQFEQWRETRKNLRGRIPEELWTAAVGLRNQYSVNQISQALRLNYNDLKKRISGQESILRKKKFSPVDFVEVEWQNGFPSSECTIEMEDAYGSKMRMSLRGHSDLDLLELGKAFLSKGK